MSGRRATSYRLVAAYMIPLIVAVAVSAIGYHQARRIAPDDPDLVYSFHALRDGWEEYKEMRQEWRGRILSNATASAFVVFAEQRHGFTERADTMYYVVGVWTFGWLLLTSSLFIALMRERALLYIVGTFGAIMFAYTPTIGWALITPYELPALFVFACFVSILALGRMPWLVVLVPIGTLFKETALILPLAFLFWKGVPLRRRVTIAAGTFLLALAVKGVVDVVTENPSPILTMTGQYIPDVPHYLSNLQRLLTSDIMRQPLLLNAGLLLALLLLPATDRLVTRATDHQILMLKTIAVVFVIGNLLFGVLWEYRVWFEMIPLSLYAIDRYFFGSPLVESALTRRLRRQPVPSVGR